MHDKLPVSWSALRGVEFNTIAHWHFNRQPAAAITENTVSGRRGIQIWVPVSTEVTFDDTRAWVEGVSRVIGETVPDLVSWKWEKRSRGGKARLDYTQNAINKTLVAPYSVRAAAGAPVSMPIRWDELDDPELRSDRWTIRDAGERLVQVGDLLAPMLHEHQKLPPIS